MRLQANPDRNHEFSKLNLEDYYVKRGPIAALLLVLGLWYAAQLRSVAHAQNPAAGRSPQQPQAYPERAKASQEVLDRGKAVYGVSCAFCHGSDAGGGEIGPNLLRSGVVLEDQSGELLAPIVHGARADKGMPRVAPVEYDGV